MNESDARHLLLVRAVESEDAAQSLLTREDRRHASEAALAQGLAPGDGADRRASHAFLASRSRFAFDRLAGRFPIVAKACRSAHWPGWIGWLLPLAAFALGAATNEIDNGRRLNIIGFPLIGMLVWNLVVYVLLLAALVRSLATRRGGAARSNWLTRLVGAVLRPAGRAVDAQPPLGRALARFGQDWLLYSSKLTYSRAGRTLNLSAALLAAGVLAGMYVRALGIEYRAGWESTFVEAPALHGLMNIVLGPASALTGVALPAAEQLQTLRWSERPDGVNAAPWIHLYATTALIFIIGPRLLLAGWHHLRAARLQRRFPVPGMEDFYVRRLIRSAGGGGSMVQVVPYSFTPSAGVQGELKRLLTDLLGEKAHIEFEPQIAYGAEDEWLAASGRGSEVDHLVILFNLSATPEAENQGALVAGVQRLHQNGGARVTVLLDETGYRQRLASQSGADARIATRRSAWEAMLRANGVKPLALNLDGSETPQVIQSLEGALMHAQTPEPA